MADVAAGGYRADYRGDCSAEATDGKPVVSGHRATPPPPPSTQPSPQPCQPGTRPGLRPHLPRPRGGHPRAAPRRVGDRGADHSASPPRSPGLFFVAPIAPPFPPTPYSLRRNSFSNFRIRRYSVDPLPSV